MSDAVLDAGNRELKKKKGRRPYSSREKLMTNRSICNILGVINAMQKNNAE